MSAPATTSPPVVSADSVVAQFDADNRALHAKLVSKDPQIVRQMKKYMDEKKTFYSFEYFPPKTREGVTNLYARVDRMDLLSPLFMDLTWGAGGSNSELALEIAGTVQGMCAAQMMLHLTCTNMPVAGIKTALERAKKAGIRNILALRGDPPKGLENWEATEGGFSTAAELVTYIRKEYGDYFGIGVSGYPEGHIECKSLEDDIKYLKAKIDCGADFIITQLFYDVDLYLEWIKKIRAVGVTVPVIPGIMPIQNYNGFIRMTSFCKTAVPQEISDALERVKDDDDAVKQYGIELGVSMCRKLIQSGVVPGLHFYTLNLERSVAQILEGLGFITPKMNGAMPWKQSLVTNRSKKEDVRPIFWANRPRSYLERTIHWDEFPNGRWGDATSPAFGDLSDYHLCNFRAGSVEQRQKLWGVAPKAPVDVFKVFADYIDGTIERLPWCENPIQLETVPLKEFLKQMNMYGMLTINSQPRVNGISSSDSAVGWGGPGGYVYQKSYMEFFTSHANLSKIMKLAEKESSENGVNITITALNLKGDKVTNIRLGEGLVNAVTWGVFPNREIVQPTVVDVESFGVWKDEAFALWKSQWQPLYEPSSESYELIQTIHDTYYLVNMVDNDYVKGDLQAFIAKIMQ